MSTIKIVVKEAIDTIEEMVPRVARGVAEKSTRLSAKTRQIKQQIEAKDAELAAGQRAPDRPRDHDAPDRVDPGAAALRDPELAPTPVERPSSWPDADTEAANAATAAARQAEVEAGELTAPDFGQLTTTYHGPRPADMDSPHGHHIVFKRGVGARQQALIAQAKAILERHGIDWYTGPHNLTWAPNVAGQHNVTNVREVLRRLEAADADGRDAVIAALRDAGRDIFDGRP
ncbi:MAG: hypothetical protein WC580_01310 [Agrococcus sp.]